MKLYILDSDNVYEVSRRSGRTVEALYHQYATAWKSGQVAMVLVDDASFTVSPKLAQHLKALVADSEIRGFFTDIEIRNVIEKIIREEVNKLGVLDRVATDFDIDWRGIE